MIRKMLKEAMTDEGYQDLRYQSLSKVIIKVRNTDIKAVNVTETKGGHARALVGGGFGTLSFNDLEFAPDAIKNCVENSKLISGEIKLANAPVVKDIVELDCEVDPRSKTIDEKLEMLLAYGKLASDIEGLSVNDIEYIEEYSEKYYLNNEGTDVLQKHMSVTINMRMTSKKEGLTQQTRLSFGGGQDYNNLVGRGQEVIDRANQTVALLDADPIIGGKYDVVLDPSVGGLFIHEAFGHLSEADNLLNSDALKQTMKLGRVFGSKNLNVVDDPTKPGHSGSYVYDDEGVKSKKTYLIKDGSLSGRLHSRMTAGATSEEPTGHFRAKSFEFTPIVRMGNTCIEAVESEDRDIIKSTKDGLYLFGSAGGQTSGDTFTFAVQGGYKIKDGEIVGMVRDIILTGNLFETLKNIDMIGNTLVMSEGGGCGKGGQILRTNGKGSPHIRIKSMSIGGK